MLQVRANASFMAAITLILVSAKWASSEQLPLRRYTTADGLPRDQITRIVRDSRGYLWFCTPEGLSRFDGRQFTNYKAGLAVPEVRAFLERRDGSLWAGTRGGLFRFYPGGAGRRPEKAVIRNWRDEPAQEGHFVQFDLGHGHFSVNALLEEAGGLWCGTGNGLFRVAVAAVKGEPVQIGLPEGGQLARIVWALAQDRQGTLWVGSGSGLYRRDPSGHVRRFTTGEGLPHIEVRSLAIDSLGTVWAGTIYGLCEISAGSRFEDPVTIRVYTRRDGLFVDNVRSLLVASDGRLWIGLPEAVASLVPGSPISSVRTAVHTSAMVEDIGQHLWLGTDVGAFRLATDGFVSYGTKDGLAHDAISAIFEDRKGELCVVSTVRRLSLDRFNGKRFVSIVPKALRDLEEIGWGWNQFILQDSRGEWWISTGEGLFRFPAVDASRLTRTSPKAIYTTRNGLPSNDVFRLYEEPSGDLWVATFSEARNAISRWQRSTETLHTFTPDEGLPVNLPLVHALKADRSGAIWIGCEQATLLRYQNGRFQIFTSREGVPPGDVWALHPDRLDRLWLGSSLSGVARIEDVAENNLKLIRYSTANGLSSDAIQAMAEDSSGRLYLATGRGVDRLNPTSGEVRHYSTADGLANGPIRSVHCDRQGNLWFGAIEGLSKLVPVAEQRQSAPPVLITRLSIAGRSYPVSELGEVSVELPRLSAAERNLSIGFASPEFGVAMPIRYQYRLEGADSNWSPLTTQREVHYSNLAPGSYRFVTHSFSPEGASHPVAASITFVILPPLWQRWWFLGFLATAVMSAAYAFHRYRLGQIRQLERVRTHIATDLHDDIGASLSQIAILSEVAQQQASTQAKTPQDSQLTGLLSQIANLSREMIDSMSDIVWAINPNRDRLEDLTQRLRRFASDVLTARDIACRFQAPRDLSTKLGPDVCRQVFLIFKESVNNLVRHSGCTRAEIDFGLEQHALSLRVSDDGKGFNAQGACSGQGLLNMQRRAAALGGRLEVTSQPGQGTTVALRIPLKRQTAT